MDEQETHRAPHMAPIGPAAGAVDAANGLSNSQLGICIHAAQDAVCRVEYTPLPQSFPESLHRRQPTGCALL